MKRVFVSYARVDGKQAERLVRDLRGDGRLHVWFDRDDLTPGMRWRPAIRKAIRESRYFIALMSRRSVGGRGVRQMEIREALDVLEEFPDNQVFLIPARLNECEPSIEGLDELDFADLFPEWEAGVERIRKSLGLRAESKRTAPALAAPSPALAVSAAGSTAARSRRAKNARYSVALIDLDGRLPDLARIARGLTRAQDFFTFSATTRATPRAAQRRAEGLPQLYINDVPASFYRAIAPLKVDFAICLTSTHVAITEDGTDYWTHLSSASNVDERVMFVSHAGLREYAAEAGVTFAMALANQVTSQLVAYFLDVDYHDATRDCPMDYCEDLHDIVGGLERGRFCAPCRKKLARNRVLQQAVEGLIEWGR